MIDSGARQPRVGDPGEVTQAELHPQRLEGALRGVGHHQEHVANADGRDRQRDQEHDPEELAPRHLLDGQQREAKAEAHLERDPRKHEDQGDDQGAWTAAVAEQGLHEQVDEADEQDPANRRRTSPNGPYRPLRTARVQAIVTSTIVPPTTSQPSGFGRLQHAQEVAAFEAEQQLLVVGEPDELEVDAAPAELESRQRQRDRRHQREQRQAQDDDDGRPDEQPPGRAVGAQRAERRGRPARDAVAGASAATPRLAMYAASCWSLPASSVMAFQPSAMACPVPAASSSPARYWRDGRVKHVLLVALGQRDAEVEHHVLVLEAGLDGAKIVRRGFLAEPASIHGWRLLKWDVRYGL